MLRRAERKRDLLARELHEGEAEALVQAQEKRASRFIGDEKRAREIGRNMGITPAGTVGILAKLYRAGLADDPRKLVHKLRRDLGYRVADNVVEEAIRRSSEPI